MKRAAPAAEPAAAMPDAKRAKVEIILRRILDGNMAPGTFPGLHQHVRAAQQGKATLKARSAFLASTDERLQRLGRLCATTVTANNEHTLCFRTQLPAEELALPPCSMEQMTPYGSRWTLQLPGSENLRFGFCQPELHVRHAITGTYYVTFALVKGEETVTATVQAKLSPTQTKAVTMATLMPNEVTNAKPTGTSGVARSASFRGVGSDPPQRPQPIASRKPIQRLESPARPQNTGEDGDESLGEWTAAAAAAAVAASPLPQRSLMGADDMAPPPAFTQPTAATAAPADAEIVASAASVCKPCMPIWAPG